MKIKRVDFISPVTAHLPNRRSMSSVMPDDGVSIQVQGGMVTLSKAGCDLVAVPMTNVRTIVYTEDDMPKVEKETRRR